MTSRDLVAEQRELYRARAEPSLVNVPMFNFLHVAGVGSPSDPAFATAVGGLYSVGYTLRFMARNDGIVDYKVPPLEALWWADDLTAFVRGAEQDWKWEMLLRVPDEIDVATVDRARVLARAKSGGAVDAISLEPIDEGHAAQVLHVGPYHDEGATIERLHRFIEDNGMQRRGAHHEIYLSDPRRTRPDRLRTILRQPVS